jgi:hypothetical protein
VGLGQKVIQLPVLLLQKPQPLGIRHLHPAVAGSPVVQRRFADPVLPAKVGGLAPASCRRRISMICSSLNRFRFMSVLLERTQSYYVRVSGKQVKPIEA